MFSSLHSSAVAVTRPSQIVSVTNLLRSLRSICSQHTALQCHAPGPAHTACQEHMLHRPAGLLGRGYSMLTGYLCWVHQLSFHIWVCGTLDYQAFSSTVIRFGLLPPSKLLSLQKGLILSRFATPTLQYRHQCPLLVTDLLTEPSNFFNPTDVY